MFEAVIAAYPWDLLSDNVDAVLDHLHGEIGASGVAVWLATPPVAQLRVREIEPRVVRSRGGLLFAPSSDAFSSTHCKPIMSNLAGDGDPIKRISEACSQRRLSLRGIISASATGAMATEYPEMACKNAFGAVSQVGVCLAHLDVQDYLCALMSDLSGRYGLGAVVLNDFAIQWAEAWSDSLDTGVPLGDTERLLLGTCFCDSCRNNAQTAGVDVDMAVRSVCVVVQRSLDTGRVTDRTIESLLADNKPLRAFHHRQNEALSSLLKRLAEACMCDLLIERTVSPSDSHSGEVDVSSAAGTINRIDSTDLLRSSFDSSNRRNELCIPAALISEPHGQQLVAGLTEATSRGITGVQFDHYGVLPDSALTTIKQAIRFARRSAPA